MNTFSEGKKSVGWLAPLRICNKAGIDGFSKLWPLIWKKGGLGALMLKTRLTSAGPEPPGWRDESVKECDLETRESYCAGIDQSVEICFVHLDRGGRSSGRIFLRCASITQHCTNKVDVHYEGSG